MIAPHVPPAHRRGRPREISLRSVANASSRICPKPSGSDAAPRPTRTWQGPWPPSAPSATRSELPRHSANLQNRAARGKPRHHRLVSRRARRQAGLPTVGGHRSPLCTATSDTTACRTGLGACPRQPLASRIPGCHERPGRSRVRERPTPGSAKAKAEWLSYSTVHPMAPQRCDRSALTFHDKYVNAYGYL